MAFPTAVNDQITDAVTQSNVEVVGSAPGVAVAQLAQAGAHALALALLNATQAQQQTAISAQAATTAAVRSLLAGGGERRIEIEREEGPEQEIETREETGADDAPAKRGGKS